MVELMGGNLTVSNVEHHGSTFTYVLPYKVSPISDISEDTDELSDTDHQYLRAASYVVFYRNLWEDSQLSSCKTANICNAIHNSLVWL